MLCVQRALCTVFPAANKKKGEKGKSWSILSLPKEEETDESPGWGLSSHGGVRMMKLCCFPMAEALWWDLTSVHGHHSCSGTEGRRVTNLFAPSSFSKCSDKSLLAWKSWKLWLSYEFNSKMKTLCPFPSNTHTWTDVWWLGLSSRCPDLGVEPVTHRDTTTVLPTLLSQGYTTAHRCLGKVQACRNVSKSPRSKRLPLFFSQLPGYSRGIDETLTGTTQTQGQTHGLESSKPSEWPVAAALFYYILTVGAVVMIFKERLENWLGKGMPWISVNDAPAGALGWGYMESARVELGAALQKQNKKQHFSIAGI